MTGMLRFLPVILGAAALGSGCSLALFTDQPSRDGDTDGWIEPDGDGETGADADGDADDGDAPDADVPESCGNGTTEAGEECDDGNEVDQDECPSTCHLARCGDGFVWGGGGEECDDGNTNNRDSCPNSCLEASCGDGFVHVGTEDCEDGNSTPGDGCENDCRFTCRSTADCNDDDPCSSDVCGAGGTGKTCTHGPLPGLPCDDGNECTDGERCRTDGACGGGADVCACVTTADCAIHEDGNLCNGRLTCSADHTCVVDLSTVVTCDPGGDTDCRVNECVPATGICSPTPMPAGTPCDDGKFCTATDACDDGGDCAGTGSPCPVSACVGECSNDAGMCVPASNATVCREAAGPCDVRELCSGTSLTCPDNVLRPATWACRTALPVGCDVAEFCNGSSTLCPSDAYAAGGTSCRAPAGPCDVGEACDGSSAYCPGDVFRPSGEACVFGGSDGMCCGSSACNVGWECCTDSECGCVGTAAPCSSFTDLAFCASQYGCSWTTAAGCAGSSDPCSMYRTAATCAGGPACGLACTWRDVECLRNDSLQTCGSISSPACCDPGGTGTVCAWATASTCYGTHDPCDSYFETNCTGQQGCWWAPRCSPVHMCA